MLQRIGVRGKIFAVVAVPLIVLIIAATSLVLTSVASVQEANQFSTLVGLNAEQSRTVSSLQTERNAALEYIWGVQSNQSTTDLKTAFEGAARATDEQYFSFSERLRDVNTGILEPGVGLAIDAAIVAREELSALRARVFTETISLSEIDRDYSAIADPLESLYTNASLGLTDRTSAAPMYAYGLVSEFRASLQRERDYGFIVLTKRQQVGASNNLETAQLRSIFPVTEVARSQAVPAVAALNNDSWAVPSFNQSQAHGSSFIFMRSNLSGPEFGDALRDINPVRWVEAANQEYAALDSLSTSLRQEMVNVTDTARVDALRDAAFTIAMTLLGLIASIVVASLMARTIVNPLTRLTERVGEIRDQMPLLVARAGDLESDPSTILEPIEVSSQDEIGELAEAFNASNAQVIDIAAEQAKLRSSIAETFVNVARRDQVLLNRQLTFLDQLERNEEDPTVLADLFRLDHLATRMRRNAESLLVLAGIDSGRRIRENLPLTDVIRTAQSEIEQYERVQFDDLQIDPSMHGFNALSAAHLLAELLENATVFSEPDSTVAISTGVDGGFIMVTIVDSGLGMSAEELAEANERVRGIGTDTILSSQRLGLLVVGRLARRLQARVRFSRRKDGRGTVTTVRFPEGLFVYDAAQDHTTSVRADIAAPANIIDPEVPVAVPVDLAALTDGATGVGLPRRRSADEPAAPAASGGLPTRGAPAIDDDAPIAVPDLPAAPAGGLDPNRVVLPPLATSDISPDISGDDDNWAPPVISQPTPLPTRGGLPVRGGAAPAAAPLSTPAPQSAAVSEDETAPVAGRAGMFSGFRSRQGIEEVITSQGGPEVALSAASAAAPIVAAEEGAGFTPTFELSDTPLSGGAPAVPTPAAVTPAAVTPAAPSPEVVATPAAPSVASAAAPSAADSALSAYSAYSAADVAPSAYSAAGPIDEDGKPRRKRRGRYALVVPEVEVAEPEVVEPVAVAPEPEVVEPEVVEPPAFADEPAPTAPTPAEPAIAEQAAAEPAEPSLAELADAVPADTQDDGDYSFAFEPVALEPDTEQEMVIPAFAEEEQPEFAPELVAEEQVVPALEVEPDPPATRPEDQELYEPAFDAEPEASSASEAPAAGFGQFGAPAAAPNPAFGFGALPTGLEIEKPREFAPAAQPEPKKKGLFGRFRKQKDAQQAAPATPAAQPPAPVGFGAPAPVSAAAPATPAAPFGQPTSFDQPAATQSAAWSAPSAPSAVAAPASDFGGGGQFGSAPAAAGWEKPEPAVFGGSNFDDAESIWQPGLVASNALHEASTSWQPDALDFGPLDEEVARQLAARSDIQEQAFSEFSSLTAYRPQLADESTKPAALTKRVPTAIPQTAASKLSSGKTKTIERDAEQLRSRLSSFQSAVTRGRAEVEENSEGSDG